MMKMMIKREMNREWIEQVCFNWHFGGQERALLEQLAGKLEAVMEPQFFYRVPKPKERTKGIWKGVPYEKYALCLATLGAGTDLLLESYGEKQLLLESYMLECLSMEILFILYEKGGRELEKACGFPGRYDFLETKLEEFLAVFENESENPVKYRKGFLIPQKSVIYITPLSERRTEGGSVCHNCTCADCMKSRAFH